MKLCNTCDKVRYFKTRIIKVKARTKKIFHFISHITTDDGSPETFFDKK